MPVCAAGATRCASDAQETCGEGGQWGPAKACDIACDAAGSACVVPVQVAAGGGSACALLSDGTVRCWGSNSSGQLGNGTDAGSLTPTPVVGIGNAEKIVGGVSGFCTIGHDKSAACWGSNEDGQIAPNANGANDVIRAPVVLGLADVRDVALGQYNLCAVTGVSSGSSVLCRGFNTVGQLGNGATAPSINFETVKGLPASNRALGVGGGHACAVTEQGATFCWGGGTQGQTGDPARADATEAVPIGGNASVGVLQIALSHLGTLAVRDDGALLAWGGVVGANPSEGGQQHQPRLIDVGMKVLGVSTALSHTWFVGEEGSVWCFGYNSSGQVGIVCPEAEACEGDYVNKPVRLGAEWAATHQVAAGSSHSCALSTSNEVYCWGSNSVGQLGIGHASDYEPPSKVVWK